MATKLPPFFGGTEITNPETLKWFNLLINKVYDAEVTAASGATAAAILAALITVDGSGSGLDADLLDGLDSTAFLKVSNNLSDLGSTTTARTNLGVYSTTEVDSAISALSSVYQPLDSDLTTIAALTSTTDGLFIVGSATGWVGESDATARTSLDVYSTTEVDSAISALAASLGTFAYENYATPPTIGGTTPAAGYFTLVGVGAGSAAAPSVQISTTTTGWYSLSSGTASFSSAGTRKWDITSAQLQSSTSGGFALKYAASSDTVPNIIPNASYTGTGIGSAAANNLSLIAGSVEGARLDYTSFNIYTATNLSSNLDVTGNITLTGTVDGRDVATDGAKLDGIESGATADQTAAEILTLLLTVDGSGSGLDADLLDALESTQFLRSDASDSRDAGVYTTFYNTDSVLGTTTSVQNLVIQQNNATTGDAFMTFNVNGGAGAYLGLDRDTSQFFVGGWDLGATKYKLWNAGNDGSGSGLDADTLDTYQASEFPRKAESASITGVFDFTNGLKLNTGTTVTDFKDEDTMVSNSATAVASQQSIKAYVDAEVAAGTNVITSRRQTVLSGAVDDYGRPNFLGLVDTPVSYANFDGTDTATTFSDANSNLTHTFNGNAQLDTAQYKFGTASLLCDGTNSYDDITGFLLEAGETEGGFEITVWFMCNAVGKTQQIFYGTSNYVIGLGITASNYLTLLASSNHSSWNIANNTSTTTTIAASTWYRARLTWDGSIYKVYLSNAGAAETEEISVTNSTAFYGSGDGIRLGWNLTAGYFFDGWIDDFYYVKKDVTLGTETPSASAVSLATDAFSLAVPIRATDTHVYLSYASGFDATGDTDYIDYISADTDTAWSSLTANATNYLYRDYDSSSYGFTENLPPWYGPSYTQAAFNKKAWSDFEGADGDNYFTDANGDDWTFSGNAQIDTAQYKFGSSSLLLDGSGDYVTSNNMRFSARDGAQDGFVVSFWLRQNALQNSRIWAISTSWGSQIGISAAGYLYWYLSGQVNNWTISNGLTSTTTAMTTDTWYHFQFQWDGSTYKAYIDGVEELSVDSTVPLYGGGSPMRLGSNDNTSNFLNGWIDDFTFDVRPVTHGTFTPPTASRGALAPEGEHWFDTSAMKMYYMSSGSWTACNRVFLGECVTDTYNVTDVTTYGLQGKSYTIPQILNSSTTYLDNHGLGVEPESVRLQFRSVYMNTGEGANWWAEGKQTYISGSLSQPDKHVSRLYHWFYNKDLYGEVPGLSGDSSAYIGTLTDTYTQYRLIVDRGW